MKIDDLSDDLRAAINESGARLIIGFPGWLRPILERNVLGITLGRRVYLADRMLQRPREVVEAIVRHELAHVRQVIALGLPRFLYLYFREYIHLRAGGLSHAAAYDAISFEREARAAEVSR